MGAGPKDLFPTWDDPYSVGWLEGHKWFWLMGASSGPPDFKQPPTGCQHRDDDADWLDGFRLAAEMGYTHAKCTAEAELKRLETRQRLARERAAQPEGD